MNKKLILIGIGIAILLVAIVGRFYSIGYLDSTGWQSSDYPFWWFAIAWGSLYGLFLYFKKLHPFQHPVLWITLVIMPLFYGFYIEYNVPGGIF